MTSDAAHAAGVILWAAAAVTAVTAPQVPLTDLQILVLSGACGAIGGVVATLMSEDVITLRGMAMRGLASVLVAPSIVAAALIQSGMEPRLLVVSAAAGIAGMCAWPIAQMLPSLAPARLREWFGRPPR